MSTLLRKVKSTMSVTAWDPRPEAPSVNDLSNKVDPRRRLRKAQLRHEVPVDPASADNPEIQPAILQEHLLVQFRRQLARKASTFSLRTKHRRGKISDPLRGLAREETRGDQSVQHNEQEGPQSRAQKFSIPECFEIEGRQVLGINTSGNNPTNRSISRVGPIATPTTPSSSDNGQRNTESTETSQIPPPLPRTIHQKQQAYSVQDRAGGKISARMSSEQAAPPVPYTRLKEITENACEAALAGVTSYTHTDTESWNTTIINSILGALVEETISSSTSGSSPAQPQFKYVVNSTIIQHSSTSSPSGVDSKKASSRRGMHAASGAYWNNEKDGMWSFKYPGAESKGLDVVIGVIWIWVG